VYKINNARGDANRLPLYKQLIKTAQKVVGYAGVAVKELAAERCGSFEEIGVAAELRSALEHYIPLAEHVIDQATRRILQGENVPAQGKIVSIFEPHADIIKKGQREIIYGHKIFLTGGKSNLVLDCSVERGNPADTGQFLPALQRHNQRFGKVPKDVATDGGFASKDNAKKAREAGVTNIVFSALKGNVLAELVQSERIYKRLRKWRAGIEGVISTVKRAYGLVRCNWRSFESFQAYVQLAVIAYNLKTLALKLLA
jgi:IS5 family transposase